MKSVLLSVRPQHVANILNGIKTIEIRKKFPSDYVGWVYIYCTKGKELCWSYTNLRTGVLPKEIEKQFKHFGTRAECEKEVEDFIKKHNKGAVLSNCVNDKILNGKVVARFWCDKVEHIEYETCSRDISGWWKDNGKMFNHKDACLTYEEMFNYIGSGEGYAIHITKLEIFDKPKEISEFSHYDNSQYQALPNGEQYKGVLEPLTRAPQSFMFIEV